MTATKLTGTFAHIIYSPHGGVDGLLLDVDGDFIHVKPGGFAKLELKVGDRVTAEGDAHFLSTGGARAVQATSVNREAVQ